MTGNDGGRRPWTRRLLLAAPGLVAPAVVLALCIEWFVHEAQLYASLPLAVRTEDGDPFTADAGMFVAAAGIACTLLLFAPPLLAALPRRLRLWQAIVALVLQAAPLIVAWESASYGSARGWLALLGFAYVPALVVARLVLTDRAAASRDPTGEASS